MSKRRMSMCAMVFLAMVVIAPWAAEPTEAGTILFSSNEKIPFGPFNVYVPCADGGAGEVVVVSGYLHEIVHVTEDSAGGFHYHWSSNAAGLSGVGLSTGKKYRGTGCANESVYQAAGHLTVTYTYVDRYGLIGQGKDAKSRLRVTQQTTIDANGNFRAIVNSVASECY